MGCEARSFLLAEPKIKFPVSDTKCLSNKNWKRDKSESEAWKIGAEIRPSLMHPS